MAFQNQSAAADGKQSIFFEALLAAILGGAIALAFTLATGRSPLMIAVVTFVSALLVGELAYSILFFRRQNRDTRYIAERMEEQQALEAQLRAQRLTEQSQPVKPAQPEPYRHHENHLESPGLDQGQLTSRLPDDTPLLERLDPKGRERRQKKCEPAAHEP